MLYWDTPNLASFVFPTAVIRLGKKRRILPDKEGTLVEVRVVQRFVTIAYLGGVPVATFHWTSTVEGPPGAEPGLPVGAVIAGFPGGKNPTDVIREWKVGKPEAEF
jgi:hypothetical protein